MYGRVTHKYIVSSVLHPLKKFSWFTQHMPDKVQDVYQMFLRSVCSQLNNVWKTNIILDSLNNTNHPQVLRHPILNAWFIAQQTLKLTGLMLSWAQIHIFMVALTTLYKQRLICTSMTCHQRHIPISWHSGRLVMQIPYYQFSLTLFRRINTVILQFLCLQWMC